MFVCLVQFGILLVAAEDPVDDEGAEQIGEDGDVIGELVGDLNHQDAAQLGAQSTEKAVGKGMVDFAGVFAKFREIGYDRYCIIEREISGEEQLRDILSAKVYLEDLWKKSQA